MGTGGIGTGGIGTGGTTGTGGTSTGGASTGGAGTGGTGTVSCPAGESRFDGRCYFVVTSARSNSQAQLQCTSRGAGWHLAIIGSASENTFVASLAGSSESWIGGSDAASEGRWVWTTGETFWNGGLSGAPAPGAYANFLSGEPNNSGGSGGSDCLRIVSGGGWRDVACNSSYRAICERN